MTESPRRSIKVGKIPGPDFTFYRPAEHDPRDAAEEDSPPTESVLEAELPADCFHDEEGKKRYSFSPAVPVECGGKETEVRALACRAYRGKFWSITARCDKRNNRVGGGDYCGRVTAGLRDYAERKSWLGVEPKDFLGYYPDGYPRYSTPPGETSPPDTAKKDEPPGELFLNDIYTLCRELDTVLFLEDDPETSTHPTGDELDKVLFRQGKATSQPGGLVVITGATDSSKSLITRGLIFLLLERVAEQACKAGRRKPHLVTFEDPIEKYYLRVPPRASAAGGATADPEQFALEDLKNLLDVLYIDYTPRERGVDADSLRHVVEDALRQTPAVLFVGETRERDDWKTLLQFANTGHLVITTSHAKSVVEAMSDLFRDTKTKTQAQRSEIARRILGVVNIRKFSPRLTQPGGGAQNVRALLPALWKSTPSSTANLVADGLASILPAQEREKIIGYYGRKYFAKALTRCSALTEEVRKMASVEKEKVVKEVLNAANEWDFEGV